MEDHNVCVPASFLTHLSKCTHFPVHYLKSRPLTVQELKVQELP